jgi:hypothetical protein
MGVHLGGCMQRYSLIALTLSVACGGSNIDEASFSGSIGSAESTTDEPDPTDASAEQGDESSSGDASDSDSADSSSSDDGADESSSSGEVETCEQAAFDFVLAPTPPNVMLVLDKSRSMSNLWDHDIDPSTPDISRWHSLYNVVESLTVEFEGRIAFGAQLFPSATAYLDEPTNDFSCHVESAPEVDIGLGTGAQILAAMPAAEDFSISGGTPTVAGLDAALSHLMTMPAEAPRAILLLTDGAANCSPDELPEDTLFVYDAATPAVVAAAWQDHAIPTYVIGINILDEMGTKPAVNPYEALTEVADAGGVAASGVDHFYNSFNEVELVEALDIVANQIECTITLQDAPEYPEEVAVTVDGQGWAHTEDCEANDGWTYTTPMAPFNAIRLCGEACTSLQGGGIVEVDYMCPA